MSLTRLMVVLHPMDSRFKSNSFINKNLTITLCILSFISFLFSTAIGIRKKILSSLCSPFLDPTNIVVHTKRIIIIVSVFHVFVSISIVIVNIVPVKSIRHSAKKIQSFAANNKTSSAVHVQLITISISNIVFCLPADIGYVTALFLSKYSMRSLELITVLLAPSHSLLLPTIFTVVLFRKDWEKKQSEISERKVKMT